MTEQPIRMTASRGRRTRPRACTNTLLFVAALTCMTTSFAQDTGYIEVRTDPSLAARVLLNGTDRGPTVDGVLLISTVYPGVHTVRIEAEGMFPQEFSVEVQAGQVAGVFAGGPESRIIEEPTLGLHAATLTATSASLAVQCFPADCQVRVVSGPALSLEDADRTFQQTFGVTVLNLAGLPEGEYEFAFAHREYGSVNLATGICHGENVGVLVDFTREPIELFASASVFPDCDALMAIRSDE